MEAKDLRYLIDGLSATVAEYSGEIYESLKAKGRKRLGKGENETPAISELIRKTREEHSVSEMLSRGKKGREELIQAIASEVKLALSRAGVVTRSDLLRIEKRLDEIEAALGKKES